ncbi:MAG: sigma-70 family RNA polymerase sigma factor [Elusimicrobia bacterium]|nr:sigma-70 family RNA polymerase sigma factor [Elusimicrobiota bacterium]
MTDEELARRAAQGDSRGFEELVERTKGRLYSFLWHRVGPGAEDVFQEVWMKVWRGLPRWEPREPFSAWLFTIARHAAIDFATREGRRLAEPLEDARADVLAEAAPGPERLAEANAASHRVDLALAELPEEQREVFLLREYGRLSFKEIAALQGCPLGTALARMRYALEKLKIRLEGYDA